MSTVFSKNKEKRSRSSSNEANNSFVKNVTSRVSGLLPATITKWFSSPSSSNANGSTPAADATDSSTEDEAPESPTVTQPPSKRMRFSSPGKYNHFPPSDANCIPTNIDTIEQITPYSIIQSPPGRTTFRRETNYASTPIRSPNEETVIERSERENTMYKSQQHTVSNVGPSVATKRKSLFESSSSKDVSKKPPNNAMVDPKAPCFKPSLLGSPFYPGRTMYGGASMYMNQPNIKHRKVALVKESNSSDNSAMSHSARRVMDLLENYSSPLMEAKRISQFVKSARNDDTLDSSSSTISGSPYANKILSYKTQELHVPNIATILRLKKRSRLMDTTNAARQIIASHSSSMPEYVPPYSTSNLQKESEKESSSKLTTKVKTRLTRQNRGESSDMEEQLMPVNLPTAVLQIDKDNLPKFTFGNISQPDSSKSTLNPMPKFTLTSATATLPVSGSHKIGDAVLSKPETVFTNDSYKFSSPVRISSESHQISSHKFTFGSPERGIDKPKTDKKKDDDSPIVVGTPNVTEKLSVPKTTDWQCPDCWVNNKTDVKNCVCCGSKQPAKEPVKTSKCTICKLADSVANTEKCVNCEKIQTNNNFKMSVLKQIDSTNWKCEDCWVSNDENVDKCVCCGANNPVKKNKTAVVQSPIVTNLDVDWKCDDCWIKNKSSADKCAACGGPKPGSKQSTSTLSASDSGASMFRLPDNSLKIIAKSQSNGWECQICLVRNENNRTKCVCCESDKPGSVKESDKKSFNFGMPSNTSFKFGIDPKAQESGAFKMPEVKVSDNLFAKPEVSETNNNTLPKTPFSFGIPAKKTDDQIDAAKDNKITETPKVGGFTFGIPKAQSKTETPANSIFGSTAKPTEVAREKTNTENEKVQEVPKVDFKFSAPKESPNTVPSLFGTPLNAQENKDKPSASSPLLVQLVNAEKKEPTGTTILQTNSTSSESVPQKSTFTFSGIGIASNLFTAPASTASTFSNAVQTPATTAASITLFQKPEPSSTPALSLFQKPEVATTSTISLFQKSETTTTAAPPSLAATAPIFSFGSNNAQNPPAFGGNGTQSATPPTFGGNGTQTAAPQTFGANSQNTLSSAAAAPVQTEKPKFNFTFGGTTPMFNNSTFSATTDNNSTPNKFSITGNSLSGNGLSAVNPLAGGNGLAPSKLGGSGELNANPLAAGNEMPSATGLFGTPTQKENLWSTTNNSSNLFVTTASTNPLQKPATFTFGSNTPFNASSTAPAFGSNPSPAQNMFGMNQNASAQPTLFSSPVQNQSTPSMFGSAQPAAAPAPTMNLFGSPSVGATPTFGAPNPSIPSFEAPSLTPAPAPAFNFGAPQTTGVFGFGQQPQQPQMPQQAGVYSFGATPCGPGPQVQFNMGSAPNTGVRRVRKAIRRNPQR